MMLPLTSRTVNHTTHTGELDEAATTRFLKDAVCAQLGLDPKAPNLRFRAWQGSDASGMTIRHYVKYELIVDHQKETE